MIRIFGDFNHCDDQGRVLLTTVGSRADIARYGDDLRDGMKVQLYMDDVEVDATIFYEDGDWIGVMD